MNQIKPAAILFFFALALGLVMLAEPVTVNAQANNPPADKKEKKKVEDDDDDDDEVSVEEAKGASISLEAARAIALEKVRGTVIDEELEKERGRLQYAFDIRTDDGRIFDVEIDAVTGEVLQAIEDDEDDDDDDARTSKKKVVKKKVVKHTAKVVKVKPQ